MAFLDVPQPRQETIVQRSCRLPLPKETAALAWPCRIVRVLLGMHSALLKTHSDSESVKQPGILTILYTEGNRQHERGELRVWLAGHNVCT